MVDQISQVSTTTPVTDISNIEKAKQAAPTNVNQEDTLTSNTSKNYSISDRIRDFFLTLPIIKFFTQMIWRSKVSSQLEKTGGYFPQIEYLNSLTFPEEEKGLTHFIESKYIEILDAIDAMDYQVGKSQAISLITIPAALKQDEESNQRCEEKLKGVINKIIDDSIQRFGTAQIDAGIAESELEISQEFQKALENILQSRSNEVIKVRNHPTNQEILIKNNAPLWPEPMPIIRQAEMTRNNHTEALRNAVANWMDN